ncbi:MAG: nucleotidyl transferase AbiEii/AbiGii toxin family protein [Candidatus Thermoplasmatota archaeon]|nr:nucleotidyl transferase AbiEii/AbiGii toxin family protein [Candidatus Thermoplasmatota archaeon]MBU4256277.1 nucleotidyl transferase AbiEii/AbiGii toxin family protein [Candidatus Thermoplasmatota archaeon]
MLTRNDLLAYKEVIGFNLGQIEKDYVQHIFLMNLYRRISNELVFKGGTALQKTYGLNRFSEDLDFTLSKKIEFTTIIDKVLTGMNLFGCEATKKEIKEDELGITIQIRAKGPLYNGSDKSLTYINLEVSKREKVLSPPVMNSVVPIYKNLPPYLLPTMNSSEIMAEKIRALFTRERAKDLYDMYFLIKKGVKTSIALINNKLSYYNKEFDKEELFKVVKRKEKMWKSELKQLVTIIPEFNEVEKTMSILNFLTEF